MKSFISSSSASSFEDKKTALPIESEATSAFPPDSRLANFCKTVGTSFQRAGEWLRGLPSDRRMLVELSAWEQKENVHAQLTNAFLDYFKTNHKPRRPTIIQTGLSPKVPLDHLMEVIDRTLGDTELGKELFALDRSKSVWRNSCTSACLASDFQPWATDVGPLLHKTLEAITRINGESRQKGAEASTRRGERSWFLR